MKRYYHEGVRITKAEFDGWLYLYYCIATPEERKKAID